MGVTGQVRCSQQGTEGADGGTLSHGLAARGNEGKLLQLPDQGWAGILQRDSRASTPECAELCTQP